MYFATSNILMMRLILVFLFFFHSIFSDAQTQNKTRQSKWQQKVDYTISVKLNDIFHTLSASEKIIYTNNSPDDLREIYIHLWPNAYKNNETEFAKQHLENGKTDFYYSDEEDKGWIDSLDFKVDGESVKWYLLDTIDICKIELMHPLKPGQKVIITTPFKVKIPSVFSRMGHEGQLYCISQWYPKPAVYDVNGWNFFPYLNQGEFYSEFGKFDVSISVPKNYVVAATGDLQNEEEKKWLQERTNVNFTKNNRTDTIKKYQTFTSSNEFKTLRFVQDSVHDFAWFCDKRFTIEQSSVVLKSGKKINTFLYNVTPSENAIQWVDTAINFYSQMLGEYPYNLATAVVTPLKAGGGMEYPTITNIETTSRQVIVHEVGHNWFYGILANNERTYPWMDESFNTYYENRNNHVKSVAIHKGLWGGINKKSFVVDLDEGPFGMLQLEYFLAARKNSDQSVNIPSTDFTDKNYGEIIYAKAPLMFHYLQDYLGDSLFDAMMQSYYEKWKFKHPLPDDFFDHAKSFTGKNLEWFYQLYSTTIKPDYTVCGIKKKLSVIYELSETPNVYSFKIKLKNKSSITSPFPISSMIKDSVIETKWFDGFSGTKKIDFGNSIGDKFRIDAYETTLDVYRDNNTIRTHGIFKSVEPLSFNLLGNLENPYKTQLFYMPIIGANLYNKTMLGLTLYNGLLPKKKFDYILAPMYSFGTNDIVGYANFERHIASYGSFSQIHLGINTARFGYGGYGNNLTYNKVAPFISFDLNKKNKRSPIDQSILIRTVVILNNKNLDTKDAPYQIANNSITEEAIYSLKNYKEINKNELLITLQNIKNNTDAVKLFASFKQTINYEKPKKKMDIRLFGGAFLYKQSVVPGIGEYNFRTSGNSGQTDYLFDHALFGRSAYDGLFSRQLIEQDGDMKMPMQLYTSNTWMVSGNFVTTIPGPIPIRIFGDIGMINVKGLTADEIKIQYAAGIKMVLIENIFEVNFPLFYSDDYETVYNLDPTYKDENAFQKLGRRITFTLNLNKMNPIKFVRNMQF